jgi:tellurite resistance protein TehA-like permease
MATGIVSVGLSLVGRDGLSRVLLVLAGVLWLVLASVFLGRLVYDRGRWEAEADTPPALTAVAATTVLGTRLSLEGWQPPAAALLALAAALWLLLIPSVIRHVGRRMPGAVFLVCVATEGLAVLGATLAPALLRPWLGTAAVVPLLLGLLMYAAVLPRFDPGQVRSGAGDQWVAGGALAISALAASKVALVAAPHGPSPALSSVYGALRGLALVLLVLDLAWYLVLAFAEVRRPRPGYDVRRWATVFPLGMTAVACLSVAAALDRWLPRTIGHVLLVIAFVAWCAMAIGTAAHLLGRRSAP